MDGHPLLQRIAHGLDDLARPGDDLGDAPGILVGFSGGPDSLALLLGAHHWRASGGGFVAAAHLHHGMREDDAAADLAFCRDRCARLDIPLHTDRQDARPVARRRGQGLEEAARHLRLAWLRDLIRQDDRLALMALGHNLDDQAETVLMRLMRGTGPVGLRGMLPRQGDIIRPLLGIRRTEILAGLEEMGEIWRTDRTNLEGDNLRALMRRKVNPVLDEVFGPGAHLRSARATELLADDLELLDKMTAEARAAATHPEHPEDLVCGKLLDLEPALAARVMRTWLGTRPDLGDTPGQVHIAAALQWLTTGTSGTGLDLPGGRRLERVFDRITLNRTEALGYAAGRAPDFRVIVAPAADSTDSEQDGRHEGTGEVVNGGWRIHCHTENLIGNLRVDHPMPGDRMRPLGLAGSKKLSDLMREARIPAAHRERTLVIRDQDGILWVVGVARDERTRLLPTGGKMVTISVIERTHDLQRGT
ncbi:tRNA lysidine(34) synthetase TilS [bacterium]|nr:tRNA lysidine(34) synthetase TilS [bacterium]